MVVVIHGGGWVEGTKEERVLEKMPYLQMGFAAVNVEYRLGRISLAPAAVEDCRCALHWVFANARKYNFDPSRVVLQGGSAGGHLALMTGMLTPAAGFERECRASTDNYCSENPGTRKDPRVAAIVNRFGITTCSTSFMDQTPGDMPSCGLAINPTRMRSRSTSRPSTTSLTTSHRSSQTHGDKDFLVPYEQAVRLHKALDAAKVPNELHTVAGADHGGYAFEQSQKAWATVRQFLQEHLKGLGSGTNQK